jgi:hypothetical protein
MLVVAKRPSPERGVGEAEQRDADLEVVEGSRSVATPGASATGSGREPPRAKRVEAERSEADWFRDYVEGGAAS